AELAAAGVAPDDLEPFVVDRALVADLLGQVWGSSFLEDHPLLEVEDGFVLASPASVSVALRNHFIRFVRDNRFESAFDQSLAKGYARLFAHEPLLGMVRGARVPWQSLGGALLASVATEFDRGYRLAPHFLLPSIGAHPPGGFAQGIEAPEQIEAAIQESVQAASREAEKEQSFRGGMHLVVACGWGLGLRLGLPPMKDPRWSLDILTAADLITMSEVEGMSPWRYWRMLAAKRELRAFGVKFANVNGPLNM